MTQGGRHRAPAASSSGGVHGTVAGVVLRAPDLHGSSRGGAAEVYRGSGKPESHRRREIARRLSSPSADVRRIPDAAWSGVDGRELVGVPGAQAKLLRWLAGVLVQWGGESTAAQGPFRGGARWQRSRVFLRYEMRAR